MNSQRFLSLLVVALLVLSGGLYLSVRRSAMHESTQGAPLYPTLSKEFASIGSLSIRKASAAPTVTLQKKGQDWTVAQRADYPADVSKLRKLLLSLTDAKIIETKTADPANFAAIGVEDPTAQGASGTQIDFSAQDGAHSLIVGKPAGEGNFVRRGGENQSYSVQPGIFVETEPKSWIDPKLIDIPVANIQRIEFKPAGAPGYSVHRLPAPTPPAPPKDDKVDASASAATPKPVTPSPPEPGFALDGVPAGRKAANKEALAPTASNFSGLSADDVAQASDVDFSKPTTASITMSDGSVLTLTGVVLGDKHWIQLAGIKDAAFSAKSAGRAYQLPGYRYDGLFRPLEQLLVPKETPAPAKTPSIPAAGKSLPKPRATPPPP